MNIGIIGTGHIGATLARLFSEAGHHVATSNSRGPESLADVIRELGPNVKAMTVTDAALYGDVVVEAIPFGRYQSLPVEQLAGKILISAANYYPGRDGQIKLGGHAHSELIAEHLPTTKVVKAFNTIWYQHLGSQGNTALSIGERRVIFIAGDDLKAKEMDAELITEIGFGPLDIGSLAESKTQEPGTRIYNVDVTVNEAQALLRK